MIIASSPLRISIAGGSTDLEDFIQAHGHGSVISFPSNLRTYISLHADVLGINRLKNNYVVNYSEREEESKLQNIKNDVARVVLEHFKCGPVCCSFTSDVFSSGSGLASSSSYLLSFIKAVLLHQKTNLSDFEICKLALKLEREFNPLTGQQDTYGCGLGSLKKLTFYPDRDPTTNYLPQTLFDTVDMYLLFTDIRRNSTSVLQGVKKKGILERLPLLEIVKNTEAAIINTDKEMLYECINEGWKIKKKTSPLVVQNTELVELDTLLDNSPEIKAHRLCGAGNGGFFLLFLEKGARMGKKINSLNKPLIKVTISEDGIRGVEL
jgi:D-glycero-alpha-D-manno-heptose-7-phosphate kinase